MFRINVSTHSTVTEQRAPTDESVKLLRDMEQKARDEVIKAMQIPSTTVSGVVHAMRDLMRGQMLAKALVKINGKHLEADAAVDEWEVKPHQLAGALRDALAKVIATEVLTEPFMEMLARDGGPFKLK